jgi:hypothetical protein
VADGRTPRRDPTTGASFGASRPIHERLENR